MKPLYTVGWKVYWCSHYGKQPKCPLTDECEIEKEKKM